jgi:hypothetical protein
MWCARHTAAADQSGDGTFVPRMRAGHSSAPGIGALVGNQRLDIHYISQIFLSSEDADNPGMRQYRHRDWDERSDCNHIVT